VAVAIAMPKLGMTMAEGTVVAWNAQVGQAVAKGQSLLVIESEKAEVEIDAPIDGVLRHVYVEPGAVVPCGTLLAALTGSADEAFDAEAFRRSHEHAHPSGAKSPPGVRSAGASPAIALTARRPSSAGAVTSTPSRAPVSPAARRRAKELGVEAERAPGSGPGGRVTSEDVDAYAARMVARIEVEPGVRLDVQTGGAGEPLVLLPGFGSDASAFAPQVGELAKRWRVLVVNPRGVAFSDAPDSERYDIARAAEDAARVANGPLHVVGASMGAAIAIELALAHPDRVRSLVLVTPFVHVSARLASVADAWVCAASAGADVVGSVLVPWMFSETFLADVARRERAARSIAQTSGRVPTAVLQRWAAGLAAWSGTRAHDLARIATPTLVVAAGDDLLTPPAEAETIAAAIPGARLQGIEGSGHAVSIERATAVTRAIVDHVATHSR
jgi:3-oxoadipate enol-lactonase